MLEECGKSRDSGRGQRSPHLQDLNAYSECLCGAMRVHVPAWVLMCPSWIQDRVCAGENVHMKLLVSMGVKAWELLTWFFGTGSLTGQERTH